jgi:hypothetical protein
MINYKYKQIFKKIILGISIFCAGFLISLAQNQITVLKTDNRGFYFYYNPTSTPGFERKLKIGLSSYTGGSFGYPLFEFSPDPRQSQGYLDSKNTNIFSILNFGSTTNLISRAVTLNPNQIYGYTKILFMPKKKAVIFDTDLYDSYPFDNQFRLASIYANLKNLIAVYSCEDDGFKIRNTCLGQIGIYKEGFEPPATVPLRSLIATTNREMIRIKYYQNPDYCFGETDSFNRELHYRLDICLGDCGNNDRNDEGLTICIRQR